MFERLVGLAVTLIFDACFYVLGIASVMNLMRRDDYDLYAEWMDRREARREQK